MDRIERQQLRALTAEVAPWVRQAAAVQQRRTEVERAATAAVSEIRSRTWVIVDAGQPRWRLVALRTGDEPLLGDVARHQVTPTLSNHEQRALDSLTNHVAHALRDAKSSHGIRRLVASGAQRNAAGNAAEYLTAYEQWGRATDVGPLLARLATSLPAGQPVATAAALNPEVGLRERLTDLGPVQRLVSAQVFGPLPTAIEDITTGLQREGELRSVAIQACVAVRTAEAGKLIAQMPLDRLKDATREQVRVTALKDAGFATVLQVLHHRGPLEVLPGIGPTSATRIRGAAQTLWQTTYDEMPVRIDIRQRSDEATLVLRRLIAWDGVRALRQATSVLSWAESLAPFARTLDPQVRHVLVLTDESSSDGLTEAVDSIVQRAQLVRAASGTGPPADPWEEFMRRPADFYAMLSELGFMTEDEGKAHGDLPDEIVDAVRALTLDTEHLTASLRGYQSFGARFALVQRKVIIGDEMGLGKTVEALAVLAHLRSYGQHHFLVVCPAAVVTNWMREVGSKSRLRAHRIHGYGREHAAQNWRRNGGVAITTFETLAWFERVVADQTSACVVVDEAHYVKNPDAQRSRRVQRLVRAADRAIFLTGTPLENRIEEFGNLVGYLRPDLVVDAGELAPRRFRRQVAPAYLRRNQEDVLTELPELIEVDEWLPMSPPDARLYREAVVAGNFMAMRQAAMLSGQESEKVKRLIEIVGEAEDNNRRVLVFSHFLEVLSQVTKALPGSVFGPLTGAVPAARRQEMIDLFSKAGHGAVLVSQIQAGGVGLNIQAASVVVICEPQLKPTTEWQAIARAHRMGQLDSVQVHRLLSEEGADRRVAEILARKRELFEDFARVSDSAEAAPEAFDVSEADLARQVVAEERERLFQTNRGAGPTS